MRSGGKIYLGVYTHTYTHIQATIDTSSGVWYNILKWVIMCREHVLGIYIMFFKLFSLLVYNWPALLKPVGMNISLIFTVHFDNQNFTAFFSYIFSKSWNLVYNYYIRRSLWFHYRYGKSKMENQYFNYHM